MRFLVLLHGYGVRGFFFEPIVTFFESRFTEVLTPDLDMANMDILIDSTRTYFESLHQKYPTAEIYLVGHSLGGILAILIASMLGTNIIKKIAVISSPYGKRKIPFKKLVKFLIVHQLIPSFITRPRFFSPQTPKSVQKKIWRQKVSESIQMIEEMLSESPNYLDFITSIEQNSIVIASESDKIVSYEECIKLAEKINAAEILVFEKKRKIFHNDFITAPLIAQEISEKITTFFLGKKNIWD
jgi:esterase/lipase